MAQCLDCRGSGRCPKCGGNGWEEEKYIDGTIRPGVFAPNAAVPAGANGAWAPARSRSVGINQLSGGEDMWEKTIVRPRLLPALLLPAAESERALIPHPPAEPALYARQQALMQRSAQECLPVRYLGTMPLFAGHRLYPGRRYDWVLVNLAEDPLFQDRDGFPVPKRVLKQLRRIRRSGVDFDALYVVHEVSRGTVREGTPLTPEMLMPPPPRTVQQLSDRLGTAGRIAWTIAALPVVASGVVGGLIAAGTAAAVSMVGLDPILLGVVVGLNRPVVPGESAAWHYLGHWAFNQEV